MYQNTIVPFFTTSSFTCLIILNQNPDIIVLTYRITLHLRLTLCSSEWVVGWSGRLFSSNNRNNAIIPTIVRSTKALCWCQSIRFHKSRFFFILVRTESFSCRLNSFQPFNIRFHHILRRTQFKTSSPFLIKAFTEITSSRYLMLTILIIVHFSWKNCPGYRTKINEKLSSMLSFIPFPYCVLIKLKVKDDWKILSFSRRTQMFTFYSTELFRFGSISKVAILKCYFKAMEWF